MKFLQLITLTLVSALSLSAQQQNPIVWSASYKAISATEGEITILGAIQSGWHTYSQRPTDAGPISTTIRFVPTASFELSGKAEEMNVHEEYDKAFEAKLFVFSDRAEFKQKIKVKSKSALTISAFVEYVCCNDNMCLPPKTIELSVKIQ